MSERRSTPRDAPSLLEVVGKTAVAHTATYFVCGLIALRAFNYADQFASAKMGGLMRPLDDPLVAAGLLFQPIRGALFGLCFYAVRDVVFGRDRGWLIMWLLLAAIGIISPFGPAPGSIEGLIYTTLPLSAQIGPGLIEVFSQSLLLSLGVFYWVGRRSGRWLGWGLMLVAAIAILASLAGVFLAPRS